MRILGYPSEKISILTTYNGQASLLRDIINKRCTNNPLIGMPGKVRSGGVKLNLKIFKDFYCR